MNLDSKILMEARQLNTMRAAASKLPQGALFHQGDIGYDDGRIGPMTQWIKANTPMFIGKSVLDIGSNCGHFPIEYCKAGASRVAAVEGKQQFIDVMKQMKGELPICVIKSDMRDLVVEAGYDILSALGVAYHVHGFWECLSSLIGQADPKLLLLESEIYPADFEQYEDGSQGDASKSLKLELCLRPAPETIEKEIKRLGFQPVRVILDAPLYKGGVRGFWYAE